MKNNILYLFMYSGFMISVFIPVFRVLTYFIPLVMYFIYIKRKTIRIKCMEAVVLGLVDCFVNYVITKLVLNSSLFNSYSLLDEIDGISSTLTISSLGISLIFLLLVVYILVMVTNGKKYNLLLVSNLAKYIDKNFYNVASDILTTLKEKNKKVVVLLIMDGIGIRKEKKGNAVLTAKTPNLDKLNKYPHCSLEASGRAVGLSDCQMGNSEVGHITIGSGRVSYQSKVRIDEKVNDKTLFNNKILNDQIKNKRVHVIGLVSDGGVHSHINHYIEMVKYLKNSDVKEVFCHVITDGRDTLPDCSYKYIKMIEKINEVSSISGRYSVDTKGFDDNM
ncbi:MAG: hypothetical protein Q4G04_03935, partial [bacterium]|nr:hypothetical protein [bacterium]